MVDAIREKLPKVKAYIPEGSYVLWLDFAGYGYDPSLLMELINHRANVALQRGTAHDPDQGGVFMRLCVTCPKATVLEAVDRMAKAFKEYESEQPKK